MRHVPRLLLAYLLFKPFYIFESGGLQAADLLLLSAFVLYLILSKFNKKLKSTMISVLNANRLFILFIVMTFVVNIAYFIYYGQTKFVLSSLYFVFTFIAIFMFSVYCRNKKFLLKMSKVFKISLILQIVIYILGLGRYYTPDRYMSTFNDPNQFAFYVFISYLFIYVIKILLDSKDSLTTYLVMTAWLIYLSASTGMLLGLTIFLLMQLLYGIVHLKLRYTTVRNVVYAFTSVIVLFVVLLLVVPSPTSNANKYNLIQGIDSISIAQRIKDKTAKAEGSADYTLWEERGYDKIYKYPQSLMYGSGEGKYERFTLTATVNEVHATLPSILFYYGIIPFLVLLRWIYLKVRYYEPKILIAIAALLIESFTLLNQRQSLFWILIIMGSIYTCHASTTQNKTTGLVSVKQSLKLGRRSEHYE